MMFARTKGWKRVLLLFDAGCFLASVLFAADMVNIPPGWIDSWALRWPPFWGHSYLFLSLVVIHSVATVFVLTSIVLIVFTVSAIWAKCRMVLRGS